jgi:hypothetical protein
MTHRFHYTKNPDGWTVWDSDNLGRFGKVIRQGRNWIADFDGEHLGTYPSREAAAGQLREERNRRFPPGGKQPEKIITLQFASHTDHVTDEGMEFTKRPYPFHVQADGTILRQELWRGDPLRVVGFAKDLAVERIDLDWGEARADHTRTHGMYVVTQNDKGGLSVHLGAVQSTLESEVVT